MNYRELLERHFPFVKRNWLVLSLGVLGMIFFAYGLISLFLSSNSKAQDIVFEANSESSSNSAGDKKSTLKIVVDVQGAVVKPGVYDLPSDSRFKDALIAAGGLSSSADRNFVAKNLNLAVKLTDGSKVYIPAEGEAVQAISDTAFSSEKGKININTASAKDLDTLSGVGPVTSEKIIAGRPYGSLDELLSKKIVGASLFSQIKEKITIY